MLYPSQLPLAARSLFIYYEDNVTWLEVDMAPLPLLPILLRCQVLLEPSGPELICHILNTPTELVFLDRFSRWGQNDFGLQGQKLGWTDSCIRFSRRVVLVGYWPTINYALSLNEKGSQLFINQSVPVAE